MLLRILGMMPLDVPCVLAGGGSHVRERCSFGLGPSVFSLPAPPRRRFPSSASVLPLGIVSARRLVWKTYSEVKNPDKPLLLEMYGKYRSESEKKAKEAENLATVLEPHSDAFVVASYETSENYLPPGDFKREKYASVTEWYWVPRQDVGSGKFVVKKLKKPKADAPIKTVLEFLKKQSGADLDISSLTAKFEES
ncbi:unnamed protein product [Prorocentrum cordatum]|uniref:Uncharacterized protein n=1 Tax=Prorocentrum cordatum TaxID=2364126 RepID=A0ABN9RBG1_9DINO|nr:unnamed protein product [Polarella glacialis]